MSTTEDEGSVDVTELVGAPGPGRREQGLEVFVFVFMILPSLLLSFVAVGSGGLSFALGGTAIIFRDLGLLFLVLFFLWRNGESFRLLGWRFERRWPDVLLGVVLFFPMTYAAAWVERIARDAGLSPGPKSLPAALAPHGAPELVLATVMVVVVAVAEETIFRGYLILRLKAVAGGTVAAVVLSSIIFSLGHGYEGSAGVVTVGFMGAIFAVVYLWRGSLVAPVVMHFLQDFLGIVAMPLLAHR